MGPGISVLHVRNTACLIFASIIFVFDNTNVKCNSVVPTYPKTSLHKMIGTLQLNMGRSGPTYKYAHAILGFYIGLS